ncbi:MAG: hypothetical protein M5U26_02350 [Planctomycetota bacterium]|nr:hypothetical protein [Planctomycetota bacterium]
MYTLDRLAAKRYTEPFTKHLDDKNEEVLIRAQIAGVFGNTLVLSSLPEERALVSLQKLAEDQGNRQVGGPDEMVRQACVDAIGKIGSPKSLETLANILNQVNLSDRLKEAVVSAFYGILSRIDKDLDTLVTPPTVQKLIQLVEQTTIDPEIRAEGMKTLARLERAGVKTGNRVLPVIQKVLEKENNKVLVVAAVEALGITGKDEALDSLLKAFKDFYSEPNSKAYENDLAIRKVIAKTFAYMLSAQREKRPAPNAEAVATIAKTLISIIDPSAERKEHKDVKRSAVSSLRYLYPLTSPFKEHHKDALSRLIYLMRDVEDFKDAQDTVIETAVYLSRQDFGKDVLRWEKWFDETYPGVRVKRDTPK